MTWSRFDIFVAVLGVAFVVAVGSVSYQVGYGLGRPPTTHGHQCHLLARDRHQIPPAPPHPSSP
jgi:hypothetical protein